MTNSQDMPVQYLAALGSWLSPEDSLERAVEALHHAPTGAVAVLSGHRLCGLVSDREVAIGLSAGNGARVGDVMRTGVPTLDPDTRTADGLRLLAQTSFPALPVVRPDGVFLGLAGRADMLAALYRRRRPATIGGMATPLGVFLSDGTRRAGAGVVGLMLTGVFLFVGSLVASGLAWYAARLYLRQGLPRILPLESLATVVFLAVFALWFRLSPVAGYHAAEHQTVHAIERNEPLTPESVARMPRPHPRCGTNLAVAAVMFTTLVEVMRVDALLAAVFTLLTFRMLGQWVQQYITTRPASRKQILSGLQAGRELLEKYQNGGSAGRRSFGGRLWNSGLPEVVTGFAIAFGALWVVGKYVPFVGWLIRSLQ